MIAMVTAMVLLVFTAIIVFGVAMVCVLVVALVIAATQSGIASACDA